MKTASTDSTCQEMNHKINLILNFLLSSGSITTKTGVAALKSTNDATHANDDTDDPWDLLEKTQSRVNSIKNEINRIETQNLHQD